jgi:hypothetical protein
MLDLKQQKEFHKQKWWQELDHLLDSQSKANYKSLNNFMKSLHSWTRKKPASSTSLSQVKVCFTPLPIHKQKRKAGDVMVGSHE